MIQIKPPRGGNGTVPGTRPAPLAPHAVDAIGLVHALLPILVPSGH
ncbi:hypothetical protein [Bradyrhizobium sp. McL0615]